MGAGQILSRISRASWTSALRQIALSQLARSVVKKLLCRLRVGIRSTPRQTPFFPATEPGSSSSRNQLGRDRQGPGRGQQAPGSSAPGHPLLNARLAYSHFQSPRSARRGPNYSHRVRGSYSQTREIPATLRPRSGGAGPRQSPPPQVRSRGLPGNLRDSRAVARVCRPGFPCSLSPFCLFVSFFSFLFLLCSSFLVLIGAWGRKAGPQ